MRYVAQERERMKAGLAVYKTELTKLRQYLEEHDREKVCSPSTRMKALLAENATLRRANSVLRQNSAEHGLNTDALILSTAGLSASGLDWELLGLGPDHTGLLRLSVTGSGSLDEESAEHSFIRPSSDPSVASSTVVSVGGSDSGGLFDEEPDENPPRKRKRLRQSAVVRPAKSSSSKLPAGRRLGRPSVDLKRKAASAANPPVSPSGHKKARSNVPVPTSDSSGKDSRSPPHPILEEGEIADDAGFDPDTGIPAGDVTARSSPPPVTQGTATPKQGLPAISKSVVDLTLDDAAGPSSPKDSSPFSSPVVSYFSRQDGRPRRSSSVVSELRMRENLEREQADDDFMLGLTSEDSAVATTAPSQGSAQAAVAPAATAELTAKNPVVTKPSVVDSSVEAQGPPKNSSAEAANPSFSPPPPQQSSVVPISQLLNEVDVDLAALDGTDPSAKGSERRVTNLPLSLAPKSRPSLRRLLCNR
ncbi:hypothetical protein PHMEG_00033115, partial [Phytophthora megakarya]